MKKEGSFFEDAQEVAKLIPHGRVSSYGAIAKYLGSAKSARMVGWAMNATKGKEMGVPAHRVVNKQGLLTGKKHFGTPSEMERLLVKEGIEVFEHKIVDFTKVFWDPNSELM